MAGAHEVLEKMSCLKAVGHTGRREKGNVAISRNTAYKKHE